MSMGKDRSYNKRRLFVILMAVVTALMFFRTFFSSGVSMTDEMIYLVNGLQLCNGSALLVDDWNASQLSGLFNAPFILLFKVITGGTDGAVLFLRLVFILIKVCVFVFIHGRLKKADCCNIATEGSNIVFFVYSPYNIDTISYNTVMLLALYVILIILATYQEKPSDRYLIGAMLAFSVLSNPFCIVLYLAIIVLWFARGYYLKVPLKKTIRDIVDVTIGAAPFAVILVVVVFARSDLSEVMLNIGYILTSSNHDMLSPGLWDIVIEKIRKYLELKQSFPVPITKLGLAQVLLTGVFRRNKRLGFITSVSLTLISIISILVWNPEFAYNYCFIPLFYLSVSLLVLEFSRRRFLIFIFTTAAVLCVGMGTGASVNTISAFCCLYGVIVADMVCSVVNDKRIVRAFYFVFIIAVVYLHMSRNWTDWTDYSSLAHIATRGPLKYTALSRDAYGEYNAMLDEFEEVPIEESDILFCPVYNPVVYAYFDVAMGGTQFFYDVERNIEYLKLHANRGFTVMYFGKKIIYGDAELVFSEEETRTIETIWDNYEVVEYDNSYFAFKSER